MRGLQRLLGIAVLVSLPIGLGGDASFAAGGGGGGGGSSGVPSASTPSYDPAVEYRKGVAALEAEDFKEARRAFSRVLSVAPRDANTNLLQGMALAGLGDGKKAIGYFEKAVKYDDNLILARQQLGVARAKAGDAAGAMAARDALAAKALACGAACPAAADFTRAIAAIDAAIVAGPQASLDLRIAPGSRQARVGDGAYLAAIGLINERRYDDALRSLADAQAVFGPHPDVLTYIGFANRKLRRYDVADAYYRDALAIAPAHRGALEYQGELKIERGDMAGARANLAALDRICTFGCQQAEELRRWVRAGTSTAG